jgi:excisionase family DNA binding protein
MTPIEPDFMTVREFAARLAISVSTAYAIVRAGEIPSHRVHNSTRILRSDYADYVSGTRREPSAEEKKRAFPRLVVGVPRMFRF